MNRRQRTLAAVILLSMGLTQSGCMIGMLAGGAMRQGSRGGEDENAARRYQAAIHLTESPKTIDARVRLDPVVNHIANASPDKQGHDMVVPGADVSAADLSEQVRQALLTDFRSNLVFADVRLYQDAPDLIVKATLFQFTEARARPWYTKLPLIGGLFAGEDAVRGEVTLDLSVSTPRGRLVGLYQGQSRFQGPGTHGAGRKGGRVDAPGDALNRAFTESVRQIREEMLADPELVSGRWKTSPAQGARDTALGLPPRR